ncbi:endopeptidase La [Kiritimatiella glycovorans]|uniref:Lon protease n=1 Tax=Kiritimatiella glycovorans TaxID=1307763 RepID=A0A0G3EMA6_9BACT|nr:endopeptidase La [Kiritimatiella glycovorans]AKJ65289.1 Lon protease 2 [Kiritimatiella glycovorans]
MMNSYHHALPDQFADDPALGADPAAAPPVVSDTVPEVLPVLPLDDFVLFPGMTAPMMVADESTRKLIEDIRTGHRHFIGTLRRNPDSGAQPPDPADLHTIGCVGHVLKTLQFPDHTTHVLVRGLSRCELTRLVPSGPYLLSHYRMISDLEAPSDVELEALTRNVSQRFQEVVAMSPALADELQVAAFNTPEPGRLSDLIGAHLNLSLEERQDLLADADPRGRLQALTRLINREHEVLEVEHRIERKVSETFSRSQRENFLREQVKAIQSELGEQEPAQRELQRLKEKLEAADLPEEAKKAADEEQNRLARIPTASPEYGVIRTYLEWIAEVPWNTQSEDRLDLRAAARVLDRDHYGMKKIKDRILEYLAVLKLKRDLKGPILCLVGPPGVGKTSLGRSVAAALGRKFVRMSLGGIHDEAEIRGHRRTYIGAMPGRIIQGLKRAGTRNPVFMLDEVDKVGADFRGDPSDALLEVLDPEQNHAFRDNYLDLDFDLSRVLFITTANVPDTIPDALLDRMETLHLPGYTHLEKREIARRHLLPRQIEAHGLRADDLNLASDALDRLIDRYTAEAGVRELDRVLAALCRKTARRRAEGKRRSASIAPRRLKPLLGPPPYEQDAAERRAIAGVVTGLAWTPVGGELLFIEATRMAGEGRLILTGSLGDVMKESARAALSYLRSRGARYGADTEADDKHDIHIHVPAGAIPKDGPSAGIGMLLALASLFTRRAIRPDLAVTGEITLRGRITPVGGVKEKVIAASRGGIRHVMLPGRNRKDLEEIPKEVRDRITFKFVNSLDQALRYAFELSETGSRESGTRSSAQKKRGSK